MPAKKKLVPPVRPNSDHTGFVSTAPKAVTASNLVQPRSTRARNDDDERHRRRPTSPPAVSRGRQGFSGDAAAPAVETGSRLSPTRPQVGAGQVRTSSAADTEKRSTPSAFSTLRVASTQSSLLSCECRINGKTAQNLSVRSGSIIVVSSASSKCYLEVRLSPQTSDGCVEVNVLVAAQLNSEIATATTLPSRTDIARDGVLTIVFEKKNKDHGKYQTLEPSVTSALCSCFRSHFHNRVVYDGMRAALTFMTFAVEAHVSMIERKTPALPGSTPLDHLLLTDQCEITISGGLACPLDAPSVTRTASPTDGSCAKGHTIYVGEHGTGKSHALQAESMAAAASGVHVFTLHTHELPQAEDSGIATAHAFKELLTQASNATPALVVIDDIDVLMCDSATSTASLTASSSSGSHWSQAILTRVFRQEMANLCETGCRVRLVASATSAESITSLLTPDTFATQIRLTSPSSAEERLEILRSCVRSRGGDAAAFETPSGAEILTQVTDRTHGFSQRDLARLSDRATAHCFDDTMTTRFRPQDLLASLKFVHPSSLKQFEVSIPEVTWDDIGGSEVAKQTLREVVEWSLGKQSWVFREFALQPPKGVLLYGPPGCSKTMLAKALANESKMNFIAIKGPEVFSKWVGDSEKAVRNIFSKARAAAPCVVFIDELDGMCSHRGKGGVSDRVISQFLTELDGLPAAMSGDKQDALVFVAATNRPDSIDGAVLRPGRIDRKVHVGLPELSEREAIVRIQLKRMPTAPDLDPAWVAEQTPGYSGAEVVAVVKEAAFNAIDTNPNAEVLTRDDVRQALTKVRPRITKQEADWYKNWLKSSATSSGKE